MDNNSNDSTARARNRTVMLTPEVTGQVRARLLEEIDQQGARSNYDSNANLLDNPTDSYEPSSGGFSGGQSERPLPVNEGSGFNSYRNTGFSGGGFGPRSDLTGDNQGYSTPTYVPQTSSMPLQRDQGFRQPGRDQGMRAESQGKQLQLPPGDCAIWAKETPVVGFLVSFDNNPNGDYHVLRSGRLVITSEHGGTGNFLYLNSESVSPSHAILRISTNGEIQVLDQLSDQGTRIKRFGAEEEEELSGDKSGLDHGDCICFGTRRFHVCIVPVDNG